MSRKNFVAVRIRRQLEQAADNAGLEIHLKVSVDYWAHMQANIRKEVRRETRVEYQRAGLAGRWGGRPIFMVDGNPNEPLPYPGGLDVLESIAAKKRGEELPSEEDMEKLLEEYGVE